MANVFTLAKAYQKKHPRTSWQDCIKACSGKKKPAEAKHKSATVGRVQHKKATPASKVPKKIKVKIKPGKKGSSAITISGIHLAKTKAELAHQHAMQKMLDKHKTLVKEKGLSATEKAHIRREIAKYQGAVKTSKQHVTALKRHI